MPYILKIETKILSNWLELDRQTKRCFQTKLRLENCLSLQKFQGKFFLKLTMPKNFCNCNRDLCH